MHGSSRKVAKRRGILAGVALAVTGAIGCSAPAATTRHPDPCAPPAPAAPSLVATDVWQRPAKEGPLSFIREVGDMAAVCSRGRLYLLRADKSGKLTVISSASLSGCHRLASDGTALAVLEDSGLAFFPKAGQGDLGVRRDLSSLPAATHDVAVAASGLFLAADDGVHHFVDQSGSWVEQAPIASGTAVRALAVQGGNAYLGEQGAGKSVVQRYPLSGGSPGSIHFDGLVEGIVVQSDRGLAITGGFGLVTFAAGKAFGAAPHAITLDGVVSDARVVGGDILAVNRISLERIGPLDAPARRAWLYRHDRGSRSGSWIVGVAVPGAQTLVLRSDGVERVSLAPWTRRPLLVTDRVREDVRDGSRSFLLRVLNHGQSDLVLGQVHSDSPDWSAAPSTLDPGWSPDPQCPLRLRIAPDNAGLLDVRYSGHSNDSNAVLTLTSNDSDQPELAFSVTRTVPAKLLAIGDIAPDFSLPLLGGGELGLRDIGGHVAYLKFFNPG